MLVFGALQIKSSNNGGIEVIHNGTHEYLSKQDVQELSSWIASHIQRAYEEVFSPATTINAQQRIRNYNLAQNQVGIGVEAQPID